MLARVRQTGRLKRIEKLSGGLSSLVKAMSAGWTSVRENTMLWSIEYIGLQREIANIRKLEKALYRAFNTHVQVFRHLLRVLGLRLALGVDGLDALFSPPLDEVLNRTD